MPKDLSGFLSLLAEKCTEEDFVTVSRRIRPAHFEVTALLENLTSRKRFPAVLFNNPEDVYGNPSEIRLVSNIFARRERCALALDMAPEDCRMPLSLEYARREKIRTPPVRVSGEVPVQEVVLTGKDVNVGLLPIVRHYEMDLSPVLTMTCCMRDPDTGSYDVSFIKNFYKGRPDYLGVSIHSPHLERILRRYTEMNKPAPIITILGHHPAFFLGALALTEFERDDYESIGSFLGEPLRLAPSVTWGEEFLVPADAEIIIEGEILPGVKEVVDPFGEVTRHYQAQCLRQAMQVKAVTRRRKAIMQDIFSGHEGHWNLGAIPKEGSVYNAIQSKVGNVVAVHIPLSGIGRLACYVSIKKVKEGQGKLTGLVALNESWTFQVVVVVDEDIDVFNEQEVIWALLTMVDPGKDVTYIKNLDTMFTTAMGHNKVVIDATRPLDRPFPKIFRVPERALKEVLPEDWLDREVLFHG
jgi:UbiD family decarboxylase